MYSICMCIYIYVDIYIHVHMYIHMYISTYLSIYLSSSLASCLSIYVYVHVYGFVYVYLNVYLYVYVYENAYVYVFMYYVYIYIYTYIDVCTLWDKPFFWGRTRQICKRMRSLGRVSEVSPTSLTSDVTDVCSLCQGQLFQTTLKTTFTELVPVSAGNPYHIFAAGMGGSVYNLDGVSVVLDDRSIFFLCLPTILSTLTGARATFKCWAPQKRIALPGISQPAMFDDTGVYSIIKYSIIQS